MMIRSFQNVTQFLGYTFQCIHSFMMIKICFKVYGGEKVQHSPSQIARERQREMAMKKRYLCNKNLGKGNKSIYILGAVCIYCTHVIVRREPRKKRQRYFGIPFILFSIIDCVTRASNWLQLKMKYNSQLLDGIKPRYNYYWRLKCIIRSQTGCHVRF